MMRTVRTKNIDGHCVVVGFGELTMDPMATVQAVQKILTETTEHKKLVELRTLLAKRQSAKPVDTSMIEATKMEISEAIAKYLSIRTSLLESNKIYFEPAQSEEMLRDEEWETLKKKHTELGPNESLVRDGSVIPDFRGRAYWIKKAGWQRQTIDKIGQKPPAGAKFELTTEEQRELQQETETRRIRSLPERSRKEELDKKKQGLLRLAAFKRSELEISGETNALEISKKWYSTELSRIVKLYESTS
jgi:hypothetical protein